MSAGRIPTTANSPLTVKGDLFTFSTGSAKLAVGANDTALVADSTQSTGLAYKTKGVFNGLTTTGDTIYSSSGTTQSRLGIGSTGQVLTVASGIPSWATASSGALTLIKARTSFNNVASTTTSFDSMFSSTYYNYIIVLDGFTAVTANATLMFQWRSGGTTNTSGSYYSGYNNLTWNGTSAPVGNSGGTYVSIATLAGAGNYAAFTINYYSTQAADTNAKLAWTGYSPQLQGNVNGSGFINVATNWDGFILTLSTGNIYTGSVTVYGLAKA